MTLLQLESFTVRRGVCPVVDGAGLAISAGEFVGLIGPNGAGKTTILRMIMGITAPDRGQVFFHQGEWPHRGSK